MGAGRNFLIGIVVLGILTLLGGGGYLLYDFLTTEKSKTDKSTGSLDNSNDSGTGLGTDTSTATTSSPIGTGSSTDKGSTTSTASTTSTGPKVTSFDVQLKIGSRDNAGGFNLRLVNTLAQPHKEYNLSDDFDAGATFEERDLEIATPLTLEEFQTQITNCYFFAADDDNWLVESYGVVAHLDSGEDIVAVYDGRRQIWVDDRLEQVKLLHLLWPREGPDPLVVSYDVQLGISETSGSGGYNLRFANAVVNPRQEFNLSDDFDAGDTFERKDLKIPEPMTLEDLKTQVKKSYFYAFDNDHWRIGHYSITANFEDGSKLGGHYLPPKNSSGNQGFLITSKHFHKRLDDLEWPR